MKQTARSSRTAATGWWAVGAWCIGGILVLLSGVSLDAYAQNSAVGAADNFTLKEYHQPPFDKQVKSQVSGSEAQPQANGCYLIKNLRIESFSTNGVSELIIEAPSCTYDSLQRQASSPGSLQVRSGDGLLRIDGEGFLWRQKDASLIISNRVHTVIEDLARLTKR